jgi:hypothetical protein
VLASLLHDWFSWPDGAVLTNLIASFVWALPGWLIYRVVRKHLDRLHEKIDRLHRHLGVAEASDADDSR